MVDLICIADGPNFADLHLVTGLPDVLTHGLKTMNINSETECAMIYSRTGFYWWRKNGALLGLIKPCSAKDDQLFTPPQLWILLQSSEPPVQRKM